MMKKIVPNDKSLLQTYFYLTLNTAVRMRISNITMILSKILFESTLSKGIQTFDNISIYPYSRY